MPKPQASDQALGAGMLQIASKPKVDFRMTKNCAVIRPSTKTHTNWMYATTDELPVAVRTNVTVCKRKKKLSKKTSTKTKKKSKASASSSSFVTICMRYLMHTDKPLEKVQSTTWLQNKHNDNLFIIGESHGKKEKVECASIFDAFESIFNENHKLSSPATIDMFTEDSDWGFAKLAVHFTEDEATQLNRFRAKYRPCIRTRNCLDNTVRFHFTDPGGSSGQAWMDLINNDFIMYADMLPPWEELPDLIQKEFTCENDLNKLLTANQYVVKEANRAGIDMAFLLKYFHIVLEETKKKYHDWKRLVVLMSRVALGAYTTCRIVKYSKYNTNNSVNSYPEMCGLFYAGNMHATNVRDMLLDPLIGFSEVTRVI